MTSSRRRFLAAGAALTATPLLGAPSRLLAADDEATLWAAAKKEGRGMLYSNAEPLSLDRTLKAFNAKYGLEADVQRLTAAPLAQRFSAEIAAGIHQADLFISSDPLFARDAVRKGWLARPDDLPEAARWPKSDLTHGLVSLSLNPYVMAWNTNIVKDEPRDWQTLNDPRYRGRVLVGDPRVLETVRLWFVALRRKYGNEFIRTLGSHAIYSPSAVPGMQQLSAGAVALYAPATFLNSQDVIDKGAPVKFLVSDPVVVTVPLAAVIAKAPHPNFARLLLNFMMTREGQTAFNKGGVSLLADIPEARQAPSVTDIDPDEAKAQLPELLAMLKIG